MNVITTPRDYGLLGRDAKIAEEMGLASAQWYQCPLPRKRLKELMQRKDAPAIRDSLIWFASFLISGGLAYFFWPTWLALPFFIASLALGRFLNFFDRYATLIPLVERVAGGLLVIVGLLVFTNYFVILNAYAISLTPQWLLKRL